MMITIFSVAGPGDGGIAWPVGGGLAARIALILLCLLIARIAARYGPLYLRQDEC